MFLLKTNLIGQPTGLNDFLTPDECKRVIGIGENDLELKVARTEDHQIHENLRQSEISWFDATDEHTWLFNKIKDCINDVNANWFGYHLIGFERIQFTKYSHQTNGQADFYSSHQDTTSLPGGTIRKLSFTIQLTDS